MGLVEHSQNNTLDAILIFESCKTDSIGLNRTLTQAATLFGSKYKKSTLVILTKYKHRDVENQHVRELERICNRERLKFFMWENLDVTEA